MDDDVEPADLDAGAVLRRSPEQVSAEFEGEVVLMNTTTGVYFAMNDVAGAVWALLERPMSVSEVIERTRSRFDVGGDADIATELTEFLGRLVALGLVVPETSPA